ncbi:MAG: hypothetical protein ACI4W2_07655 [Eubacterium sp.]
MSRAMIDMVKFLDTKRQWTGVTFRNLEEDDTIVTIDSGESSTKCLVLG